VLLKLHVTNIVVVKKIGVVYNLSRLS